MYLFFKKNGVYTTKFYNDLGDDKEEDGFAVLSSFIDTCKLIKQEFSDITKSFVLLDGEGCYSGSYLAINLAIVGSITGIYVMGHFIAESGRGKSVLDGNFGVLMKHVRKVVNANLKERFCCKFERCVRSAGRCEGKLGEGDCSRSCY